MPAFSLKRYQQRALDALQRYLLAAQTHGAAAAYALEAGGAYNPQPFGEVPCVCLRIPTGGGKTLLAAHAVGLMASAWPTHAAQPLALWLVPSDTIRTQTLAALKAPGHPFREALAQACGAATRVCDLDEVAALSPQDYDAHAVIVVATIQSFRIDDTDQRNVYAFSEKFEPHFRSAPPRLLQALHGLRDALVTAEDVASAKAGRAMLARFVGQPRWSLANWLALRQPYVIVDEAHNTKTERSFEALQRLNPALVLELTATPVPKRTNVLFHVSAQELQAEHMIKMPIHLIEHNRGWQAAVFESVQTQASLEAEALQEEAAPGLNQGSYIRPIVLLQAQNSTDAVNVDVLRAHLIDELHIPPAQIKVATGTQRELDGLDLASRDCPVRFIITVQALREGWDCPFAYVLCSVQSIRSATAIEQLLGRVLRMPYARPRTRPALNRAYAHLTETETGMAANALADRLIDGMGFDPLDMASMVAPQLPLGHGSSDTAWRDDGPLFAPGAMQPLLPALAVDVPGRGPLPTPVVLAHLAGDLRVSEFGEASDATRAASGVRVHIRGAVSAELSDALVGAQRGKQREAVAQQIERHNALVAASLAPAHRGQTMPPVPRLCYRLPVTGADVAGHAPRVDQGELVLLEREALFEQVDLNLLAEPISLPGFHIVEQAAKWEVYLDGQRLRVGRAEDGQMPLADVRGTITEDDLARWLCTELQHPMRNAARDITPSHLRAFVLAAVRHLVHEQRIPLEQLVRQQYPLVQGLQARVAELRDQALGRGFAQLVLGGGWAVETSAAHSFHFDPANYPAPANGRYSGKFSFKKHFYPVIAKLKAEGEEFQCALALDQHKAVKHWVRNLDSDPVAGFWMPTSQGRFYPDFIAALHDGRVLVAEYKGEHLLGVPKEMEKSQVGRLWAEASGGHCLFATLVKQRGGLNVAAQLDALFGSTSTAVRGSAAWQ